MSEFWWGKYYERVSDDEYFETAYDVPAYGEFYDRVQSQCRFNNVEILDFMLAYPCYFDILYEERPEFAWPLYLRDKKSGEKFLGYLWGGQIRRIQDYDIISIADD